MIYGIGTDVIAVERVAALWARHGERFGRRVLAPEEWDEYAGSPSPARFLAKRFAAKEAFSKAMGTGLRGPVSLGNIRVTHDRLGKPMLQFADALGALLRARGIGPCHLSISDERDLVAAFVVLEWAE